MTNVNQEIEFKNELVERYGEVLNTTELQQKYVVEGFGGGYCVVKNKETGVRGSLEFSSRPRFYYNFVEHKE